MEMRKLVNKTALESLIRRNWGEFIDKTRIIAFVLEQIRENDLPKVSGNPSSVKQGIKVTLSKVELVCDGLLFWIDFSVPTSVDTTCVGTCEAILSHDGEVHVRETIGHAATI